MKKLKAWLERIPRPVRAIFYTVLAVVLAISYYIALGCPTLSLRQEFRRAEKAHMIGPSKIVDTVTNSEYSEYEKMLVGETEHGICFFGQYDVIVGYKHGRNQYEPRYTLTYYEKTGDITLGVAPNLFGFWGEYQRPSLPVYLFTEHKNAVRATLQITIDTTGSTRFSPAKETFVVTADRSDEGFFRYALKAESAGDTEALDALSSVYANSQYITYEPGDYTITVLVKLYDAADQLIVEQPFVRVPGE